MALHVRYSSLSPFYRGENWVSQKGGGSLIVTLSHRQMRMDAGYEPSWKDPKATAFNLHSVNLFAPTSLAAQLLRLESQWLWRPTVYPEEVTPPPGTQSSQSGKRQNKPLAFNFLKLPRDLQSSPQGRQKSSLEMGGIWVPTPTETQASLICFMSEFQVWFNLKKEFGNHLLRWWWLSFICCLLYIKPFTYAIPKLQ